MELSNQAEIIFLKLHPLHRVLISLSMSALVLLTINRHHLKPLMKSVIMWDAFAVTYLITCWIVLFKRPAKQIKNVAQQEDGSRLFVFAIILISSFASMVTVLLLIISKDTSVASNAWYLPVAIAGMLLSWSVVHTTFAIHYAHIYYGNSKGMSQKHKEGLSFPEEKEPDYLDFAYFSFVIGMTFQVSDVEITSRQIRRIALGHGLLSFGLNTFVVALTINIIAGLQH